MPEQAVRGLLTGIRRVFCRHREWWISPDGTAGECKRCGAQANLTGALADLAKRVRDLRRVVERVAVRSEVTVREALTIGALGVVYVTLGLAGGLLLAVYA